MEIYQGADMIKKILFLLIISFVAIKAQDTTSVLWSDLPVATQIDSSKELMAISQAPLTYRITWKNLQRSLNFKNLVLTNIIDDNDYFAITHTSGGLDTAKGITWGNLIDTIQVQTISIVADSTVLLRSDIDTIAGTLVIQNDTLAQLRSDINQNVSNISLNVDSLVTHRTVINAHGNLIADITDTLAVFRSGIDILSDSVGIFSSSIIDIGDTIVAHRSSIELNADSINVFSSGAIHLNSNTYVDGDFSVSGDIISGGTITGTTLQTASSGKRVKVDGVTNELTFISTSGDSTYFYGLPSNLLLFNGIMQIVGGWYTDGTGSGSVTARGDSLFFQNSSSVLKAGINIDGAAHFTTLRVGSVSNAEINYLDGVTSAIQTQLNNRPKDWGELTTDPSSGLAAGQTYFNYVSGKVRYYTSGGGWIDLN